MPDHVAAIGRYDAAIHALFAVYNDTTDHRSADSMTTVFAPNDLIAKPDHVEPVQGLDTQLELYRLLQQRRLSLPNVVKNDFMFLTSFELKL